MTDRFLFSVCPEGEFFDRADELGLIIERAAGDARLPGIYLTGRRWSGKTELLRRAHASLFWDQAGVVPVYYQFRDYADAAALAEDYLKEVLKQVLAFRRRDPQVVARSLSLENIEAMLHEGPDLGLAEFAAVHREARKGADVVAALRNAAFVPKYIKEAMGLPVYLLFDDIDTGTAALRRKEPGAAAEFLRGACAGSFSFVASGSAGMLLESGMLGTVEPLRLHGLAHSQASAMMMELCRQYDVGFDTEILSLAASKLEGNPMYIKNIVWGARRAGSGFTTLKDFIDLYAKELFDGNIGLALRSSLKVRGAADLGLLNALAAAPATVQALSGRFNLPVESIRETLEGFCAQGLVELDLGSARWAGDNVARDFVIYNNEVLARGRSAEEVRTAMVRDGLKEGFNLKGAVVRGRLKEDVSELLSSFNGQKVLRVLFDNGLFISRRPDGKAAEGAASDAVERKDEQLGGTDLTLPQVIGCFDSGVWEKRETGPRIFIANGFENNRYDAGNEVVWITAVKDTISPVNIGDVENFLRRSQILRQNFRTTRLFKWMVGKEGFTAEARKRLEGEGVLSTDAVQMRILKDSIEDARIGEAASGASLAPNKEFEVVLPASTKAELVAARAVEEIGTEMGFDETAIGQIKAALVEACINAFEHSGLKQSKVFLRFVSSGNRLVIHVQNGGIDFERRPGHAVAASDRGELRKRGWGLELIKGLMDEVRFEKIRGGTKIVMVKYLIKGAGRDEQA